LRLADAAGDGLATLGDDHAIDYQWGSEGRKRRRHPADCDPMKAID